MADIPTPQLTGPTALDIENIEKYRAIYKNLSDTIKDLGFADAIKQFKEATLQIKEITDNAGLLDSNLRALKKDASNLATALSEANGILEKYPISLAEANKKLSEALQLQAKINEENDKLEKQKIDAVKFQEEETKFLAFKAHKEEYIKNIQEKINNLRKEKFNEDKIELQEKYKSEAERELKIREETYNKDKKHNEDIDDKIRKQKESADRLVSDLKNEKERTKNLAEQAAAYIPLLKFEELRNKSIQNASTGMSGIVDSLIGANTQSTMFTNIFFGIQKSVLDAGGGIKEFWGNLTKGLTESFLNPEAAFNRVVSFIDNRLIKSTLEFDKVLANVGKNTGGFRKEFEQVAIKLGGVSFTNLSEYGVDIKKYGEAYAGLSKNVGGFNNMMESQKKVLIDSAASMNTLGISADNYGKLVAKFMGSIGKTAEGSRDMINKLAADAVALGKDVSQYTSEFETAMSRISGYGREATQIFKELNAVSAATRGVVTAQDLLSISDKFKDFDSAADSVSKLNAMLGGTSVNMLDMMQANPAEQIMMIKRAAGEAGLQFDNLNIGYKRLLAEYFSGDINKAQAFFNADMATAQRDFIANEKELEERKKANVAFQDKLNALMDNMKVVLTPLIGLLNKFASILTTVLKYPGTALIGTLTILGGLITGLIASMGYVAAKAAEVKARFVDGALAAKTSFQTLSLELSNISKQLTALNAQMATTTQQAGMLRAATSGGVGGGLVGPNGLPLGGLNTTQQVIQAEKAAASTATNAAAGAGRMAAFGRMAGNLGSIGTIITAGMIGASIGGVIGGSLDKVAGTGEYRQKTPGEISIGAGEVVKTHPDDKATRIGDTTVYSKETEYSKLLKDSVEASTKRNEEFTGLVKDSYIKQTELFTEVIQKSISEPLQPLAKYYETNQNILTTNTNNLQTNTYGQQPSKITLHVDHTAISGLLPDSVDGVLRTA